MVLSPRPYPFPPLVHLTRGRKAFKLFPANASESLHVYKDDIDRSPVDAFNPDYAAYPKFRMVQPIEVVVGPGDVI